MSAGVTPLRPSPTATRQNRVVSPELALVDPILAAEERARLPERPASPQVRAPAEPLPDAQRALQELASAAHEAHALDIPAGKPDKRAWPRLVAVAVVTALTIVLLDLRVDVGRTPAAAESSAIVAPAAEPSPETTATATEPPAPAEPTPVPRRFAWAPVAGADAYRVEFFRGNVRVYVASPKTAQLTVPASWTLGGKRRMLTPGEYRWYVWPITSGRTAQNAVVQATLVVP
jgi:hypothetical protein